MHTNQNYYEYHKLELQSREKTELSIKIDARRCNMAPEGRKFFPGKFFINVKEASGIVLRWAKLE